MGLDHSISVYNTDTKCDDTYEFRKVNALQGYFERNYNVLNNRTTSFDFQAIYDIAQKCEAILEKCDVIVAEELLPVTEGFFYGDYEYGTHYFDNIRRTLAVMNDILKKYDKDNALLTYWCWF